MKTRILSGIVLIILSLIFLIIGGNLLLAVCAIISVMGLWELYRVFKIQNTPLAWVSYAAAVVFYLNLKFQFMDDIFLLIMAIIIALMCILVFAWPRYHAGQIMKIVFGFFYVAVMISFVYQTRMLEGGIVLVWLIFICSWVCDACAYFIGSKFGKHKMTPQLSPKKSWEGALGGIAGAFIVTLIFGFIVRGYLGVNVRFVIVMAIVCAVGGLAAEIGDLCASAIKRNYKIKDYAKLIPGHGGIMDRFDSVIFTAPIIYFLAYYFII